MSDYTQVNDYSAKDALASGDANKIIKGSDVDSEFGAIATAIATKADTASPTFTGTVVATGATMNVATATDFIDSQQVASTAFVRNMLPAGVLVPYAGTASPDTNVWLLCDGAAVSRTTYAVLFALISTTFGTGDGSTTFNLPDLRGRVPMGMDNFGSGEGAANRVTDADADSLGGADGAETHTLTEAQLAAHDHTITVNSKDLTVNTATADIGGGGGTKTFLEAVAGTTIDHNHTATSANAGSGSAHNNMQPFLSLGYLIKV